jgi:hypothetical protein
MKNEDEILKELMTGNGNNYIMDDGFTSRVMEALPTKKAASPLRRTLLILTGTLAGCALSASLCGPSILETVNTLADRMGSVSLPEGHIWAYVYLGAALVFSSLIGILCLRPGRS